MSTGGKTGRVLVIACGALAREITALTKLNAWQHVTLKCLPAIWHVTPEKIAEGVEEIVLTQGKHYDNVFVAYADCGTGGRLEQTCKRLDIDMIEGPHCYSFYEGQEVFDAHAEDELTAFYLTDFLARQFEAFVIRPLGLDRYPDLRDTYFGHYEKLVYLAQIDDEALDQQARIAAERLGLKYERRVTGYGDLQKFLSRAAKAPNSADL
ncbi:MAG: DUF1638 domain-containing protein [Rhodobacteraceae bacterium]|nr:DUF1638 domain-containing protein [Paracoccaceae bacterium]